MSGGRFGPSTCERVDSDGYGERPGRAAEGQLGDARVEALWRCAGGLLAGGVTYFAFFSLFPAIALPGSPSSVSSCAVTRGC